MGTSTGNRSDRGDSKPVEPMLMLFDIRRKGNYAARDIRFAKMAYPESFARHGLRVVMPLQVAVSGTPSWKRNGTDSAALPLHAPLLQPCSPEFVPAMMADPRLTKEDKESLLYLSDASLYPVVTFEAQWQPCEFTREEIIQLRGNDLFLFAKDQSRIGHFSILFAVGEPHKTPPRRRVVQDTLSCNVLCAEPHPVDFTPIPTLRRVVFKGTHGATFDVKAMYYHFALSPEVSERAFRVLCTEGFEAFTRLPMGFKWAAKIAQVAITFLTLGLKGVTIELYIDNIMFVGSKADVTEARRIFLERCVKWGFRLGEDSGVVTTVNHRGITFDLTAKTIRLTDEFVVKFLGRLRQEDGTWADRRALLGSIIYAASVTAYPLAELYYLLKWSARHSFARPASQASWWQSCKPEWDKVIRHMALNPAMAPPTANSEVVIITDAATETRMGAVIIILPSGRILQDAFVISDFHSINDMEAQALYIGLQRFPAVLSYRHILYWGDNTSVLSTLRSTYSKSFFLNMWVGRIIMRLETMRSIISPFFVPSLWNAADAPTRFAEPSNEHRQLLRYCRHVMRATRSARLRGVECWRGEEKDPLRPRVCISLSTRSDRPLQLPWET